VIIVSLSDQRVYGDVVDLVSSKYPSSPIADTDTHRGVVRMIQDDLNETRLADRILEATRTRWLMRSGVHLRAARPNVEGQESVTWHRESFYGCPTNTMNVWMPVLNCTSENSVKYVPGSETIPNERFILSVQKDKDVEKNSDGSKIGLLYEPQSIVSGVDFSLAKTMTVPYGMVAIFSGQLIHGAAVNKTDGIRFSVDFRFLPKVGFRDVEN